MSAEQTTTGSDATQGHVPCVLWHAPGRVLPPGLTEKLASRGVRVETCTSPYAAVARLCEMNRELQTAIQTRPALLLLEPDTLPEAAAVVRTVSRYVARAVCWLFSEHRVPPLSAVTDADVLAWERAGGPPPEIHVRGQTPSTPPRNARPPPHETPGRTQGGSSESRSTHADGG